MLLEMAVDTGEDIEEVGFRVDPEYPAVLHQGKHHGCSWTRIGASNKEPIARAQFDGPKCIFGQVVIDAGRGLKEAFAQRSGPGQQVTDRLGHGQLEHALCGGKLAGTLEELVDFRQAVAASQLQGVPRAELVATDQPFAPEEPVDGVEVLRSALVAALLGFDKVASEMSPTVQVHDILPRGNASKVTGSVGLQDSFVKFQGFGRSVAVFAFGELKKDRPVQGPVSPQASFPGRTPFGLGHQGNRGGIHHQVRMRKGIALDLLVNGFELLAGQTHQRAHRVGSQAHPVALELFALSMVRLMVGKSRTKDRTDNAGIDTAAGHDIVGPWAVDRSLPCRGDKHVAMQNPHIVLGWLAGEDADLFTEGLLHHLSGDRAEQLLQVRVGNRLVHSGQIGVEWLGPFFGRFPLARSAPLLRHGRGCWLRGLIHSRKGFLALVRLGLAQVGPAPVELTLQGLHAQAQPMIIGFEFGVFGLKGFDHDDGLQCSDLIDTSKQKPIFSSDYFSPQPPTLARGLQVDTAQEQMQLRLRQLQRSFVSRRPMKSPLFQAARTDP